MNNYKITLEQKKYFNENAKYILNQSKINLNNIDNLKEDFYFEMSKKQIIDSFKKILSTMEKWQKCFDNNEIFAIQKEYKNLESNISELEFCLTDLDDTFHCEGISYALYQIGNLLIEILNTNKN